MPCFGVAEQTQRLLSKLADAGERASVLVVSDSTAAGEGLWPDHLARWFAAQYPGHAVAFVQWDQQTERYEPPRDRTHGDTAGPDCPSLTVHNLSVSGKTSDYALGCLSRGVLDVDPDLILVALGLNEGSGTVPPPDRDQYRAQYLALTETLALCAPLAGMVLVLQNPETTSNVMTVRNGVYAGIARMRRCGLIDVHAAFLAQTNWDAELMRDNRHPNAAGQQLWAGEVQDAIAATRTHGPLGRRKSSLVPRGRQLLANGDFATWDESGPRGWVVENGVAERETQHVDRGDGRGCWVRAASPARASYLEGRISGVDLAAVQGRTITASARVFVPVIGTGIGGTAGLLEIDDHREPGRGEQEHSAVSAVQRSRVATLRPGCFVWVCATRLVDPRTPAVTLRLFAGTGGDGGPGEVTVDRITVALGLLPRDYAR